MTNVTETRRRVLIAFKQLRKENNLIARANYMCCTSCAGYQISEDLEAYELKGKPKAGHVFWNRQSEQSFQSTGEVYLQFSGTNDDTVEVGRIIAKTLRDNGIVVEWNETPTQCIRVIGCMEE